MFELVLLKDLDGAEQAAMVAAVTALQLLPSQDAFVGTPSELVGRGMAEPERQIFAIVDSIDGLERQVVGTGTLHRGGGEVALDWPGDWVLLRAFLIGSDFQGRGYGTRGAAESAVLAQRLFPGSLGVVLGVNEANLAGQQAYRKAGYDVVGDYVDPRSGLQFVMSKPAASTLVDASLVVN